MDNEIMGDIQRTLGRIEQKIDSHIVSFDRHVTLDMEAYKAISTLKTDVATQVGRQKGFITAIGVVATLLGSTISYVVHKFFGH